ncbi:hypothetical protein MaudCBS49596_000089 [Microsporum audouinii]
MEMNNFIGRRFNLVSMSDIRYVGTLHDINPEASTIALENVISHGTEGRRGNASEEVPPASCVYEYIVFRGSDVKDINFADNEKENQAPEQPQVPNDPAILGTTAPPRQAPAAAPAPAQAGRGQPAQLPQQPPRQQPPPGYPQQPPYPNYYNPYGQQFRGPPGGPPGFPGAPGSGFPNMPYGQQGWYPPPGQGFPQPPGPFGPPQMPIAPPRGPPGQQQQPPQQQPQSQQHGAEGTPASQNAPMPTSELPGGEKAPKKTTTPAPATSKEKEDQKPSQTKPEPSAALASQAQKPAHDKAPAQPAPEPTTAAKNDRIIPAIPLAMPLKPTASVAQATAPAGQQPNRNGPNAMEEATRAATAAVAAAMAKLPQPTGSQQQQPTNGSVESVTKKLNEMRPFDGERHSRGGHHGPRGRGGHRGHHHQQQVKKIDVPTTDYDFESANAKFNKQDLVKEAIASGSPLIEAEGKPSTAVSEANGADGGDVSSSTSAHATNVVYDKTSSFFDNLSSEMRDREENARNKTSGREWRGEEEKKNMETFGQGSVDSGYRGRGRGRGRGFGGRGRGYNRGYGGGRGRGSFRGGRVATESTGVPSTS